MLRSTKKNSSNRSSYVPVANPQNEALGQALTSELDLLSIRTSAFEIYSVVAALFAGSAWHAVLLAGEAKFKTDESTGFFSYRTLEIMHVTIMSVVAATGVYTTLIFAICSIYTKTALAQGKVAAARDFLADSQYFRDMGFKGFVLICLAFPTDMVCLVFANIMINDNHVGLAIGCSVPVLILTVITSWHVMKLFNSAGIHIFKAAPDVVTLDSLEACLEERRDSLEHFGAIGSYQMAMRDTHSVLSSP